MAEDSMMRDSLARYRTHLANERTLLAYLRTGLGFLLTAGLLLRFDQTQITYALVIISIALGLGLMIFGFFKFFKVKTKIDGKKY